MTRSVKLSKQMSKTNDGLSNNKARKGAMEDIQKLVQAHNSLARITQDSLDKIENRLDDMSVIFQAISNIVGVDAVKEESKKIRIALIEAEVAQQQQNVDNAVKDGKLVAVEVITENSLVVTEATKPDGTPAYPSKNIFLFGQYNPEIQAILRDKKVGDSTEIPGVGGMLTVKAIYEEVQTPATGCCNSEGNSGPCNNCEGCLNCNAVKGGE